MAALPETRAKRAPLLVASALAAAYVATRVALLWRFQWFVDETTFASFAKDVHGSLSQFFIAESDKKGLLPSWLGAALIGAGIGPVTAMRLIAAAGAALAAGCGGLIVRRLYGLREGLIAAALIALGPFFLVTASVGVYDSLVAGIVAAAILIALHLVERPRVATALLLGAVVGAGALTKPTAWVAAAVLPATLLLIDATSPERRRRILRWAGCALLALVLAYALASIARLTPLYDKPIPTKNMRGLGDLVHDFGLAMIKHQGVNLLWTLGGLVGYLTLPGVALAIAGGVIGWRRRRNAAVVLATWTAVVVVSVVLLPLTANPRYLAAGMVPISGFVAIGGCAVWDAILRRWPRRPRFARAIACAATLGALAPAALFNMSVLWHPASASYPALDEGQYVTWIGALTPLQAVTREIERGGGPYPVRIDSGPYPRKYYINGPWGLDLRLNGATVGAGRRFIVYTDATPAQQARARYLISDGARSDAAPRAGYRLILRLPRVHGGPVMRLYERARPERAGGASGL